MSRRTGCGYCLTIFFRTLQFILGLIVLGCGIYITYNFVAIRLSAPAVERSVNMLIDPKDRARIEQAMKSDGSPTTLSDSMISQYGNLLSYSLVSFLHRAETNRAGPIVLCCIALWYTFSVLYIFISDLCGQRRESRHRHRHRYSTNSSTPIMYSSLPNRVSTSGDINGSTPTQKTQRVCQYRTSCLSMFVLPLWFAALIISCVYMTRYGIFTIVQGATARDSWTAAQPVLQKSLELSLDTTSDDDRVHNALQIVNRVLSVGIITIIASISSLINFLIELTILCVFCTRGIWKARRQSKQTTARAPEIDTGVEMDTPTSPPGRAPTYRSYNSYTSTSSTPSLALAKTPYTTITTTTTEHKSPTTYSPRAGDLSPPPSFSVSTAAWARPPSTPPQSKAQLQPQLQSQHPSSYYHDDDITSQRWYQPPPPRHEPDPYASSPQIAHVARRPASIPMLVEVSPPGHSGSRRGSTFADNGDVGLSQQSSGWTTS